MFCLSQGNTQTYALGSACGVSTHRGQLAAGPARGRLRFHASVAEPLPVPWEVRAEMTMWVVLDGGEQAFYMAIYWGAGLRAGASLACLPPKPHPTVFLGCG